MRHHLNWAKWRYVFRVWLAALALDCASLCLTCVSCAFGMIIHCFVNPASKGEGPAHAASLLQYILSSAVQEVLPKAGLVYSEKGNLSEVLSWIAVRLSLIDMFECRYCVSPK